MHSFPTWRFNSFLCAARMGSLTPYFKERWAAQQPNCIKASTSRKKERKSRGQLSKLAFCTFQLVQGFRLKYFSSHQLHQNSRKKVTIGESGFVAQTFCPNQSRESFQAVRKFSEKGCDWQKPILLNLVPRYYNLFRAIFFQCLFTNLASSACFFYISRLVTRQLQYCNQTFDWINDQS